MLNLHLQVASGVQISLSPEDESVLAVVPISLITKLMELQSQSLLVGRTLGEELERTTVVVVTKLKTELEESTSSLKTTLETMGALKEKMRQVSLEGQEAKRALTVKMEVERAEHEKENVKREKEEVEAEEREKTLSTEVKKCQSFMLRITDDYFHQGLRQVAFFHGIPIEDSRYDIEKDVVEGKLVTINRGVDEVMKDANGEGENVFAPQNESEPSFEELFEPLSMKISWPRDVGIKQCLTMYFFIYLSI